MPQIPRSNVETTAFYDAANIIAPDSPQGIAFAEQMHALTRKMMGSEYDPKHHRFRYLLKEDASLNAYTIPRAVPPIIVLHTGLFSKMKSQDMLAAVLAHEVGHNIVQHHLGDHKNSKLEELLGADVYSVKMLIEGGFNARAAEELETLFNQEYEKEGRFTDRILTALVDVHPLSDNRTSAKEKARISLARKGYETEHPSTPMPETWAAFAEAEHTSTTDMHALAHAAGFEKMDVPAQLEWLVAQSEICAKMHTHKQRPSDALEPQARYKYSGQLIDLLKQVNVKDTPELHGAYEAAVDRMVQSGLWSGSKYYSGSHNIVTLYYAAVQGLGLSTDTPLPLLGGLRDYEVAVQHLLSAQTREEGLAYAKEVLAYDQRYGKLNELFHHHTHLTEVKLPKFSEVKEKAARGERMELPVSRLRSWAEEGEGAGEFHKALQGIRAASFAVFLTSVGSRSAASCFRASMHRARASARLTSG